MVALILNRRTTRVFKVGFEGIEAKNQPIWHPRSDTLGVLYDAPPPYVFGTLLLELVSI